MDKLQPTLSQRHLCDIGDICHLLIQMEKPELIILTGRYAGMKESGGYEFLVIVKNLPEQLDYSIYEYLDINFPPSARSEKKLTIHYQSADSLVKYLPSNYYLNRSLCEGLLLHDAGNATPDRIPPLRLGYQTRKLELFYNSNRQMADDLLENARTNLIKWSLRACAWNIYSVLYCYLKALEYIHYGYILRYTDLMVLSSQLCRLSPRFSEYYNNTAKVQPVIRNINRYGGGLDETEFHDTGGYLSTCIEHIQSLKILIELDYNEKLNLYRNLIL